jgi:2-succinyl-6-hydroxy-2,4-cyclohexadiene-1-carboxylate synthase
VAIVSIIAGQRVTAAHPGGRDRCDRAIRAGFLSCGAPPMSGNAHLNETPNADEQPLVLLHGFTNTGASFNDLRAALPSRYRVIAPDIRGHGAAGEVRPITLEGVLEDLAQLAPPQFELGGYSQGGRIALHAAFAMPDRVQRLYLLGASPGLDNAAARAERRRADEALACAAESSTIEEFVSRWARTPVLADQRPEVRADVMTDRLRNTPEGLAAALRGLGTGALPSVWHRLRALSIPVELIVGERDVKFRTTAERMVELLPDARIHIVPDAGHAVHRENPLSVAAMIVAADG